MKTKDGEDAQDSEDDEEDDFAGEQGEDEMDEEEQLALYEEHMSAKQKAKLQAAGVSIADYLKGNGPELTDEEEDGDEDEEDYDDEEEGEAEADGDPEDENGPDAVANKPDASDDDNGDEDKE